MAFGALKKDIERLDENITQISALNNKDASIQLPDGTFMVNNDKYFIDFQNNDLQLNIRKSGNNDELLIKIPSGEHQVEYTIIW